MGCPMSQSDSPDLLSMLARIDARLTELRDLVMCQRTIKDWYTNEEFAALVGKAEFTTREWCRLGRIRAEKRQSGRGKHCDWVIAHDELVATGARAYSPPNTESRACRWTEG